MRIREAWLTYFVNRYASRPDHNETWVDAVQAAFNAGWKASEELAKKPQMQ